MDRIDQTQKAGDSSVNVQAGSITINGLTYTEARQVALSVFAENFLKLSQEAAAIAESRAREITERFLDALVQRGLQDKADFRDPDLQYAIYQAQSGYARSGRAELGEVLEHVLVRRVESPTGSVLAIVLNEAIETAPKLTRVHIATLSVRFSLAYTKRLSFGGPGEFIQHLRRVIVPFVPDLTSHQSCYQHMEFLGCGTVSAFSNSLPEILRQNYGGAFSKGFRIEDLRELRVSPRLLMASWRPRTGSLQFAARDRQTLENACREHGYESSQTQQILQLYDSKLMSEVEIRQEITEALPEMNRVFELWEKSALARFQLTSVGIAIAASAIERMAEDRFDLSIWIPDR